MKGKFSIPVIVFVCLFFNLKISAQTYKSDYMNFNTYVFPEKYLPQDYYSYGVKINLSEKPISIVIDGEKKGSRDPFPYVSMYFTEKILKSMLVGTDDVTKLGPYYMPTLLELGYSDQTIESKDHFIIDVTIKNIVYGADITENQSLETPFTYTVYYKYDLSFKIINSDSKEVVMEKNDPVYNKLLSYSFTGHISGFKTKPEAVNYLIANIDKGLIYNEVASNIKMYLRATLNFWLDVQYSHDRCFFSRISKEDKNPIFLKLNKDVDAVEKWSRDKAEPIYDDALLADNAEFIEKNNLKKPDVTRIFMDETLGNNHKKYLNDKEVFIDFILKMNQYTKQLNSNDKGEKVALWACYMNIASSFAFLNKHQSSLEYLQKARLLNYQERQIKNIEDKVIESQIKYNAFFDANGEIKKDVNKRYFKYLNL